MTTTIRTLAAVISMIAVLVVGASDAHAQQKGAFGLTMGYPTSIGAVWHLSNSIALRPEVQFSVGSSESSSELLGGTFERESDHSSVEFGIGALFYQQANDRLRTYFAPRFAYARSSFSSSVEVGPPDIVAPPGLDVPDFDDLLENETTRSNYSLGGTFGGQYALHDRFSVFGEVGINFITSGGSTPPADNDSWTVGVRSAVGVILYFR